MDISVKVIQVIEANFCRGKGTEENPNRTVTAYYSLDGDFLAEKDVHYDNILFADELARRNESKGGNE